MKHYEEPWDRFLFIHGTTTLGLARQRESEPNGEKAADCPIYMLSLDRTVRRRHEYTRI